MFYLTFSASNITDINADTNINGIFPRGSTLLLWLTVSVIGFLRHAQKIAIWNDLHFFCLKWVTCSSCKFQKYPVKG